MMKRWFVASLTVLLVLFSNLVFYTAYSLETHSVVLSKLIEVLTFQNLKTSIAEFQKILGFTGLTILSLTIFFEALARIYDGFKKLRELQEPFIILGFLITTIHALLFFVISYFNYKTMSTANNISFFSYFISVNTTPAMVLAWAAYFMLFLIFLTSFDYFKIRLNWILLHKMIYLVILLAVIHMAIIEKEESVKPFGVIQFYFAIFALAVAVKSYVVKLKREYN
jgi:DMSO/TMAO reductase YedYZ heme-binding membrane subunit